MGLSVQDFEQHGVAPTDRSERFDPERPFLFKDLRPKFATRRLRSRFIPMRDGIKLSTDFYIPLGAKLPLPVVLVRTPYNKNKPPTAMPSLLPEQGIIYAIQDVRGRYESEGEFIACSGQDRLDGYDTVDWLALQPWCNGRVGTLGSSYTGETAAKTAAMCHPAHRCCVIMYDGSYGGGQTRNGAYLQGGVTLLRMLFTWYRDWVPKISFGPPVHVDREAWFQSTFAECYESQPPYQPEVPTDHLLTLPAFSLLDRTGAAPSEFANQLKASADPSDPYFAQQGFLTESDALDTPSIFLTGPLERGGSGFDNFRLFRSNARTPEARDHQYLWFTPAVHSGYAQCGPATSIGVRALGDTSFPYYKKLIDWFGHWLRDDAIDLEQWQKVSYYVSGCNHWKTAADWPPPETRVCEIYLGPSGALGFEAAQQDSHDEFEYDPADPTPSEPPDTELDILGGTYADRRQIEARSDVLVYTTQPLEAALTIAGHVTATLWVSSSAPDTDFAAMLTQVAPDGASVNITHGIARMRYRNGLDRAELMEPGEVYPVDIDLWHAAVEIPAGDRIRLAVSSAHFPFFDRNLNTGGNNYTETQWTIARNRVHHGSLRPSAIHLPVLG